MESEIQYRPLPVTAPAAPLIDGRDVLKYRLQGGAITLDIIASFVLITASILGLRAAGTAGDALCFCIGIIDAWLLDVVVAIFLTSSVLLVKILMVGITLDIMLSILVVVGMTGGGVLDPRSPVLEAMFLAHMCCLALGAVTAFIAGLVMIVCCKHQRATV